MLKRFFLNLLSSFIGAWLAIVLGGAVIVLIIFAVIGKFASEESKAKVKVKSDSVMVLDLDGEIQETETAREFDADMLLQGEIEKPKTLLSLVTALEEASEDPRIEAVYVKCGSLAIAPATAHALHDALASYKQKTKKPVYAYGDMLTQGTLYIASCADSIFLNPQGELLLSGCGSMSLYFKDLFEKIGIEWQVCKVGTYKSAVEPFTTNEMSEPARRQLMELYDVIWKDIRGTIAKGRNVPEALIDSMVNNVAMTWSAAQVAQTKLISATAYEREMDKKIAAAIKVSDPDDINFIDAQSFGAENAMPAISGDHIAVLYATGEIQENSKGGIDCFTLVPVILDLADDDDVKGLVLRVNSPGGSVFGSEQISDALNYFKSKKKPLIVSMGDYAASGGYWISCNADKIYADPLTVTGSIGIFGLIPNAKNLLNKIGVTPQTVTTNPNGFIGVPLEPLNEQQLAALQTAINRGYDQFLGKVSKGRHMTTAQVDSIGQGRVWAGATALRLGLVDELGSLQTAIKYASEKAGMKEAEVGYYPLLEPSFWDMIPASTDMSSLLAKAMGKSLDSQVTPYLVWHIQNILKRNHQQAIMPQVWKVRI